MKSEKWMKHQGKRIASALTHKFEILEERKEEKKLVLRDNSTDGDDSHVVNIRELGCTCKDFEYNCDGDQFCKHVYYGVFYISGIL